MAVDISEYLDAIAGDTDGEEVIEAIRSASLVLGTDMYKTADISQLLEDIRTKTFGNEIRMCIHDILEKLANAEPEVDAMGTPVTMKPIVISDCFVVPIITPCGIATRQE